MACWELHPNVVRSFGQRRMAINGEERDVLVLEHVDGLPGDKLAHDLGAGVISFTYFLLALRHIVIEPMCGAEFCAGKGIAHVDGGLRNLVADPTGRMVLIDFGLSEERELTSWLNESSNVGSPLFGLHGIDAKGIVKIFSEFDQILRLQFRDIGLTQLKLPVGPVLREIFIRRYGEQLKTALRMKPETQPHQMLVAKGVRPDFTIADLERALDQNTPMLPRADYRKSLLRWESYDPTAFIWKAKDRLAELTNPNSTSIEDFLKQASQESNYGEIPHPAAEINLLLRKEAPRRKDRSHLDYLMDPPGGARSVARKLLPA